MNEYNRELTKKNYINDEKIDRLTSNQVPSNLSRHKVFWLKPRLNRLETRPKFCLI